MAIPVVSPVARYGARMGTSAVGSLAAVGDYVTFSARVLTRSLTDVVLRLRYRTVVLRHVSDSFVEDPVRILRLARLAARFADFSVAPETMASA